MFCLYVMCVFHLCAVHQGQKMVSDPPNLQEILQMPHISARNEALFPGKSNKCAYIWITSLAPMPPF